MLENAGRIGFFGLGVSNTSLMGLDRFRGCKITLRSDGKIDRSVIPRGLNIERIFEGADAARDINEDLLFFSPSVRRERAEFAEARERGVKFSSDCELFFDENPAPVFAVTGSDGKSTTASILHLLLKQAGTDNLLIGNIGEGMAVNLGLAKAYVCELSSFMLTYLAPKVTRACITNITPNHLNWHSSLEEYRAAKMRLAQNAEECVLTDGLRVKNPYGIVSLERPLNELMRDYSAEVYYTAKDGYICRNGEMFVAISDIRIKEKHNILNFMTALATADGYISKSDAAEVARSFKGLPHRCQLIAKADEIEYYDSSIDSTPARTAATLTALGKEVVVILGGRSKGLDYSIMRDSLSKYAARVVITGENSHEIYSAIKELNPVIIDDFEDAVLKGAELARGVGVLLLSPASTSYDRFKNYAERGDKFKEIILKNL